jgi:hypothetical protein
VSRVLASAASEQEAYPQLLAAVGESLAWDVGAVWEPDGPALTCREVWTGPRPAVAAFAVESRAVQLRP